jgi:hypothetical protein
MIMATSYAVPYSLVQPILTSDEEEVPFVIAKILHWNSRLVRVLVPCLYRNQRQEYKQRSKEFYVQGS